MDANNACVACGLCLGAMRLHLTGNVMEERASNAVRGAALDLEGENDAWLPFHPPSREAAILHRM